MYTVSTTITEVAPFIPQQIISTPSTHPTRHQHCVTAPLLNDDLKVKDVGVYPWVDREHSSVYVHLVKVGIDRLSRKGNLYDRC